MAQHKIFLVALSAVLAFHSGAALAADVSGVSGRVSQAPGTGGPEQIGQERLAAALVNVKLQLRNANMTVVAHARTDSDGRYRMHAPAGSYTVLIEIQGKLPRCEITPVKINQAKMSKLDIECDSGLR